MEEHDLRQVKEKIKKYLELENVSILTGAGTSYHLGAPVIRIIPEDLMTILKRDHEDIITEYITSDENISFEDLFNCLQAKRYIFNKTGKDDKDIDEVISKMQAWLFKNCDTEKTVIRDGNDEKLQKSRYHYHEAFIKKLLQRPNNLKRANLFTTNYDMAFDYALDNLGVHYINGFMGVHNRCFRPEVYDYDLYYPGQSITGKVHRAEKVIKYYKIHGSLSWLSVKPSLSNTYGIKEIPLNDEFKPDANKEVMIYPCVSKKSFTLDLPYSELFRQFSQAINQPQSVLICLGYSFYDEHINDIIKQALSIPSFTLIIVNYSPPKSDEEQDESSKVDEITQSENPQEATNRQQKSCANENPIEEFKTLNDKRIIILDQEDIDVSAFTSFVDNVMPDLYEEEEKERIVETMQKLYPDNNSGFGNNQTILQENESK